VLVIDDNLKESHALRTHLGHWNAVPAVAPSITDAGVLFDGSNQFDAIVIRERHGSDLTELRARTAAWTKTPPIVSIVSGLRVDTREDGLFLRQPVQPAALASALELALGDRPASSTARAADVVRSARTDRVLVAEDNVVHQRLVEMLLRRLGYRADLVSDGRQAIQALAVGRYDIVLLDVHMPQADGIDVVSQVTGTVDPSARPWFIALTADASDSERDRCLAAGMDDFLTKPLKEDVLVRALERARVELAARRRGNSSSGRRDSAVA
jgi:CheY-like chemotaxis protein